MNPTQTDELEKDMLKALNKDIAIFLAGVGTFFTIAGLIVHYLK